MFVDNRDDKTREQDRDIWTEIFGAERVSPDDFMGSSMFALPSEMVALVMIGILHTPPDARPACVNALGIDAVADSLERTCLIESERGRRIALAIAEGTSTRHAELERRRRSFEESRRTREEEAPRQDGRTNGTEE